MKKRFGFSIIELIIILGILAAGGWYLLKIGQPKINQPIDNTIEKVKQLTNSQSNKWILGDAGTWEFKGDAPACPEPNTIDSPIDLKLATSVLYPGQMRSVGYEPTGGFRFDKLKNNNVTITSPVDGEIVQGAKFMVDGEIQYSFDVMTPCGIMHRFDHLRELPATLSELESKMPQNGENDSRTTQISPAYKIKKGDIIATATGMRNNTNVFSSWTTYDFRQKNKISSDQNWAKDKALMYHFVTCPYDMLSKSDQDLLYSLPASDSMSGKKSDFCRTK